MPETTVDKHNGAMLREYNIRLAGQIPSVEAESVSHAMEKGADGNLRLRILAPDTTHVPASLADCKTIDHAATCYVPAGLRRAV
jgi:hypothetical protein